MSDDKYKLLIQVEDISPFRPWPGSSGFQLFHPASAGAVPQPATYAGPQAQSKPQAPGAVDDNQPQLPVKMVGFQQSATQDTGSQGGARETGVHRRARSTRILNVATEFVTRPIPDPRGE